MGKALTHPLYDSFTPDRALFVIFPCTIAWINEEMNKIMGVSMPIPRGDTCMALLPTHLLLTERFEQGIFCICVIHDNDLGGQVVR